MEVYMDRVRLLGSRNVELRTNAMSCVMGRRCFFSRAGSGQGLRFVYWQNSEYSRYEGAQSGD